MNNKLINSLLFINFVEYSLRRLRTVRNSLFDWYEQIVDLWLEYELAQNMSVPHFSASPGISSVNRLSTPQGNGLGFKTRVRD